MTFSAGRRRVASPFARRAQEHVQDVEETPDISNISDTSEPEHEPNGHDAPETHEKQPEAVVESNNQEASNDASDEAQEPESKPEADDKPKRGRGRPRSTEVRERDARVLEAVTNGEGVTRAQLEEQLKLSANDVYMSLFRLRKEGSIERRRENGAHRWFTKA